MQSLHKTPDQSQFEKNCPVCGGGEFFARPEGLHIALRCSACSSWLRWVKRSEASRYRTQSAELKKVDMRRIAHPRTLEERVASLEHHLSMIAQFLIQRDS